jgi:acyl-CoA thioesterase
MGQFIDETAVAPLAENIWRGHLHKGWRIVGVPNGGYVMAVAARALAQALPHPDPLTVTAYYMAPTEAGPVDCHVEPLIAGRGTSFGAAKLYQQDQLKVHVSAAYTTLERLQGENWQADSRPEILAWEDCPSRGNTKLEFRERVDIRLAEGGEVFKKQPPSGRGEFVGWVRHTDGSDTDLMSLLMFADAFPPPVISVYGLIGWVPTIELTVQLRAHPAPGPVQVRLSSRYLTNGIVEEDGEYWDSAGQLVALSRQTAKVRMPKPEDERV